MDSEELSADNEYTDLLRQFCRGYHDESIILSLCLESAPERYSDFCELLTAIHSKESGRRDKAARLGRADASKTRVKASARSGQCDQTSSPQEANKPPAVSDGADLETVLAKALSHQTEAIVSGLQALNVNSPSHVHQPAQCSTSHGTQANDCGWPADQPRRHKGKQQRRQQPQAFFRYRCGLDGHMFRECPNHSNTTLVQERLQSRFLSNETHDRRPKGGADKKSNGNQAN